MTEIPEVLRTPSWAWLRTTVRERLETDGNAASVRIDLNELTPEESRVFRWLLKVPPTRAGEMRVAVDRLDKALSQKVTNGVGLQETLAFLKGGPLGDHRAARRQARADRIARDRQRYDEILKLTSTVPELEYEYNALLETPPDPVLRVPAGSRSGTTRWTLYELALRAAILWHTDTRAGHRLKAQQMAGRAWNDTKAEWTLPRRFAFGNLIGQSFETAVDMADTELLMRGPFTWIAEDTIAEASTTEPWIGLPANGLRTLGDTDFAARGVLLVENKEAFQAVCEMPEIVSTWLCVWGQGQASDGLVGFLETRDVPIAAWQDLDAYGIDIIRNLTKRLGRRVDPIGMSVELWKNGVKLTQSEKKLALARDLARHLAVHGPPQLRELASHIAETGEACEHQTLYREVLPTLRQDLTALEEAYYS